MNMDSKREFLRHTVATVAYRGAKAVADAPENFGSFKCGETSRTAGEILAHMGDVFDWALAAAQGNQIWQDSVPLDWKNEVERFFAAIKKFDDYLASDETLGLSAEKFFQSAVADALTHVGQIAFLRRLAESPVRGEIYVNAEIVAGRVGAEQSGKRIEFN